MFDRFGPGDDVVRTLLWVKRFVKGAVVVLFLILMQQFNSPCSGVDFEVMGCGSMGLVSLFIPNNMLTRGVSEIPTGALGTPVVFDAIDNFGTILVSGSPALGGMERQSWGLVEERVDANLFLLFLLFFFGLVLFVPFSRRLFFVFPRGPLMGVDLEPWVPEADWRVWMRALMDAVVQLSLLLDLLLGVIVTDACGLQKRWERLWSRDGRIWRATLLALG